jgi:hypothetical protein
LISGNDLVKNVFDAINIVQRIVGGRFIHLECEDKAKLIKFYEDNGFRQISTRKLRPDEQYSDATYLVQMIRYANHI